MTANKYLAVGTAPADFQETAANQTSAGAGDAGKIVALNGSGLIDNTMLPDQQTISVTADVAISAGNFINIKSNGHVQLADSSTGLVAHGFAPAAIGNGGTGTIIIGGGVVNSALTSLTAGSTYYLGAAGGVQTTMPASTGNIVQRVGIARTTTELDVEYGDVITRA